MRCFAMNYISLAYAFRHGKEVDEARTLSSIVEFLILMFHPKQPLENNKLPVKAAAS